MNEAKKELVYLAIPYTFNAEESFKVANKVAAELMKRGYILFSPVTHSHPISKHFNKSIQFDHDFWMEQDLPLLRICDKVIFVVIGDDGLDLIENSRGCQSEKNEALKYNIPIEFWKYNY